MIAINKAYPSHTGQEERGLGGAAWVLASSELETFEGSWSLELAAGNLRGRGCFELTCRMSESVGG